MEEAIFYIHTPVFTLKKFLLSHLYKHKLNFVENGTQQSQDLKYQHNAIMRRSKTLYLKEDTSSLYKQTDRSACGYDHNFVARVATEFPTASN